MNSNSNAKPDDAVSIRLEISATDRERLRAHAKRLRYGSMSVLARKIILDALNKMDEEQR